MSSPSWPDPARPAPGVLAIHLDLVGGLAGDMFVAAMLDALPDLAEPLFAELAKVRPAHAPPPVLAETRAAGLRARRFGLAAAAPAAPAMAAASAGRSHASIREQLAQAGLDPAVCAAALALLALLAQAEADVHGTPLDEVHLHELADWDSVLDVVAAGFLVARLAGAHWTASAPPLGGGTVRSAHGVLPVPAPATVRLLAGYPLRDDGVAGERVTPTGAAILRLLVAPSSFGQPRPAGRLVAVGTGAGTRQLRGVPNVTRALVFERAPQDVAAAHVATIEFDVDDMTGEEIGAAADRLRASDGVIDVSFGARTGKKGRPLTDFRLLVEPAHVDAVARACFVETATLGLRVGEVQRRVLRRVERRAPGGAVAVKVAQRPDGSLTAKAEHDDVLGEGSLGARRALRASAERGALEDGGA